MIGPKPPSSDDESLPFAHDVNLSAVPWRTLSCRPDESGNSAATFSCGDQFVGKGKKRPERSTKLDRQTTSSSEGFFEPFNIGDVPWLRLPGSTAFKRLGRYGGGSQVGVGIDVLKPGQYSNRFHYHLREEEHIFILEGSATLILGSRKYVMRERGYCCFPAGQRAGHHLFNHTKDKCVFMTIGDNKPDDIACFPDSGKARIRATGKIVPISDV